MVITSLPDSGTHGFGLAGENTPHLPLTESELLFPGDLVTLYRNKALNFLENSM
jgi:hypothetical protein